MPSKTDILTLKKKNLKGQSAKITVIYVLAVLVFMISRAAINQQNNDNKLSTCKE